MADAVRMIDLAPLSRSLDEFRRTDPEFKTLADRVAAQAAVRHLEALHEDVGEAERSERTRVDEATDRKQGRNPKGKPREPEAKEAAKAAPLLEIDEGRVLDIKA